MTNITGTTTVYGIVADPIQQVKTPQLINPLLEQRQVDGVMVPFHVSATELPKHVSSWPTCLVTARECVTHLPLVLLLCLLLLL